MTHFLGNVPFTDAIMREIKRAVGLKKQTNAFERKIRSVAIYLKYSQTPSVGPLSSLNDKMPQNSAAGMIQGSRGFIPIKPGDVLFCRIRLLLLS